MKKFQRRVYGAAMLGIFSAVFGAAAANGAEMSADPKAASAKQERAAGEHVNQAIAVVQKLGAVDRMHDLLGTAKGVFIVPRYGRAAAAVGGSGGAGILLVRQNDGGWSDPSFFNTGGLSIGIQAGAEGGAFVLVLNNEKAVTEFLKKNNFSISARAGLTVVNWNKTVQGSAGNGDVVAWSDTRGLFGDLATVELTDVRFNQAMTRAFYHCDLSAADIILQKIDQPSADPLVRAVVAAAAGPAR